MPFINSDSLDTLRSDLKQASSDRDHWHGRYAELHRQHSAMAAQRDIEQINHTRELAALQDLHRKLKMQHIELGTTHQQLILQMAILHYEPTMRPAQPACLELRKIVKP
jgi:hypothetical protein